MAKVRDTRPIDRRVARTRGTLEQALYALILERDYEEITVEDICARANVGRSTFYAHFKGKDDLKQSGLDHLRAALIAQHEEGVHSAERWPAFSLAVFEHARDHLNVYKALVGGRGGAVAISTIRRIATDRIRAELADGDNLYSADGIPREVIVHFMAGAFMSLLTWWLDGGAKLPPDRIDSMFKRLITEGVSPLG